jgi:Fe-S cluster biogenesis protein NfuA
VGVTSVVDQIKQEIKLLEPYVASHGGQIDFVSFEDHTVFIRLTGSCETCPLSFYTVTVGLEQQLTSRVPEVKRVELVD